jgi:hypothetical protein
LIFFNSSKILFSLKKRVLFLFWEWLRFTSGGEGGGLTNEIKKFGATEVAISFIFFPPASLQKKKFFEASPRKESNLVAHFGEAKLGNRCRTLCS